MLNIDKKYADLEAVNTRFNDDLQRHIDGTLPKNHIYRLGNPGEILLSAGIRDLPIELSADRLTYKASVNYHHPFSIACLKNLPKAINNPIAVFDNVTGDVSKIILTTLKDDNGSNFVAAIRVRKDAGSRKVEVELNDIKTVYPKDRVLGIVEWINSKRNSLIWVDEEKALNFISTQLSNPTGGGNSVQGINPKIINSAKNKINDFQNPSYP